MDQEFFGRVVVITGAASGIGARCAERFAEAGANVVALDIQGVGPRHERIEARHLDVTREEDWAATFAWAVDRFGRVDCLVNCAGIIVVGNIVDMRLEDFQRVFAVNVDGAFLGVKYALGAMLAKGTGSIINISSTAGIVGSPGAAAYCASKGAVRLLTKSAALEAIAAGGRVRVNSVHPAMTDTPMVRDIARQLGGGKDIEEQFKQVLPSRRFATTNEIVDAIMFLASDRSSYMNGSELVIDNGFTAQ